MPIKHVVCCKCGDSADLELPTLEQVAREIYEQLGLTIDARLLAIDFPTNMICPDCHERARNPLKVN